MSNSGLREAGIRCLQTRAAVVVDVVDRVKKREKDREELWQKLDDLHVVAGTGSSAAAASATTVNSKSPQT